MAGMRFVAFAVLGACVAAGGCTLEPVTRTIVPGTQDMSDFLIFAADRTGRDASLVPAEQIGEVWSASIRRQDNGWYLLDMTVLGEKQAEDGNQADAAAAADAPEGFVIGQQVELPIRYLTAAEIDRVLEAFSEVTFIRQPVSPQGCGSIYPPYYNFNWDGSLVTSNYCAPDRRVFVDPDSAAAILDLLKELATGPAGQ